MTVPGEPASCRRQTRRVLVASLLSGPLYLAAYLAQRSVQRDTDGFPAGLALFAVATIGLFALYLWLLSLCRRDLSGRLRLVLLCLPVLYILLWLPTAPAFSSDVFAYIAHGYVRVGLGANPYAVPSSAVAASPIGADLSSYGWQPVFPATPYGPVVTHLEIGIVRLAGDDVRLAMLLFKLVAVAAGIGTAGLIWWTLGRVRPADRDVGTVAYLWNPAVLIEVAGEGHNDALMALLVLLALGLTLRRRAALGTVAMICAALTKYLPLLLVPLQLGYWWRGSERRGRLAGHVAAGGVVGLIVTVVAFAPFWRGMKTFAGVGESGRAGHTGSSQTVAVEVLSHVVAEPSAIRLVGAVVTAALVVLAIALAPRMTDADALLRWSALIMVFALVFVGPAYWPWYVILPVALLALVPHRGLLVLLVGVSLGARLVAPLNSLYVHGTIGRSSFLLLTWLVGVALPLLAALAARLTDFREVAPARWWRRYGSRGRNPAAT